MPLRCKKCQRLGHTERFCNTSHVCAVCGKTHEDTANCSATPNCINCMGNHPASSPACPKYLEMRAIARTATEKGMTLQEARVQSYSDIAKKNSAPTLNPETEILKSQVQALQTEMTRMRTEISKIKPLEKKSRKIGYICESNPHLTRYLRSRPNSNEFKARPAGGSLHKKLSQYRPDWHGSRD